MDPNDGFIKVPPQKTSAYPRSSVMNRWEYVLVSPLSTSRSCFWPRNVLLLLPQEIPSSSNPVRETVFLQCTSEDSSKKLVSHPVSSTASSAKETPVVSSPNIPTSTRSPLPLLSSRLHGRSPSQGVLRQESRSMLRLREHLNESRLNSVGNPPPSYLRIVTWTLPSRNVFWDSSC